MKGRHLRAKNSLGKDKFYGDELPTSIKPTHKIDIFND